jgi:hypothetical protein
VLYLVLGLVLAAFGLLIAALTTANTLFAWISVAVSVLAAGLLVTDWVLGRRRAVRDGVAEAPPQAEGPAEGPAGEPAAGAAQRPLADQTPPFTETSRSGDDQARREAGRPDPAEVAATVATDEPADERGGEPDPEPVEEPAKEPAAPAASVAEPVAEPPERPVERTTAPPVEEPSRQAQEHAAVETGEPGEEQTDAADLLVVADLRDEVRVVDEHPRYHLSRCTYLRDKPTIPLPVAEARQLGFTPCERCGPDAVIAAKYRADRASR